MAQGFISSLPKEPDTTVSICLADSPLAPDNPYGTSYRYKSDGVKYKIHDHCAPISQAMRNVNDPMYSCGVGHPNSWAICGGPVPCSQLWCSNSADNGSTNP